MNAMLATTPALALLLAAALAGQDPRRPDPDAPLAEGLPTEPPVPIHTAADDLDGGAYGVWCAGRGFKAEFRAETLRFLTATARNEDSTRTWDASGAFVLSDRASPPVTYG